MWRDGGLLGFRVHLNPRVSTLRYHFMIASRCAAQGLQDLGVLDLGFWDLGLGLGFGIWVLGFRVWDLGLGFIGFRNED